MLIAQDKKENNIAEYILLMFQLEDLIRGAKFDLSYIEKYLISTSDPEIFNQSKEWYLNIIQEMKDRKLEKSGHVHQIQEVMVELVYLHDTLISIIKDEKYTNLYSSASKHLGDFRNKSNLGQIHDVEVAFQALYMKLLLKLQQKEISAESEESFDQMRILLAYLSRSYHRMKKGLTLV